MYRIAALLVLSAITFQSDRDAHKVELSCFCITSGQSPENIVRLDNNLQILLASRSPATRDDLKRANIAFNESQIQLLKEWTLLDETNDRLQTKVTLLTEEQTKSFRSEMRAHSARVAEDVRPVVARFADPGVRQTFAPYSIADADGKFTVPTIHQRPGDALNDEALAVAAAVAESTVHHIDVPQIKKSYGFRSDEEALIVSYHEVMWELMDELELQGLLQRPTAFSRPKDATPKDIGDLIFITTSN